MSLVELKMVRETHPTGIFMVLGVPVEHERLVRKLSNQGALLAGNISSEKPRPPFVA
jgi:hypothetical protein